MSVKVQSNADASIDATGATIDLRGLLGTLLRRKIMIVTLTVFGAALAAVYALQLPTRYEASTIVMLNTRTLNVVDFESVLSNLALRPETVDNEIALIRSAAILNRVIDNLELENKPEFNVALREQSPFDVFRRAAVEAVRSRVAAVLASLFAADDEAAEAPSAEAEAARRRNLVLAALREAVTVERVELSLSIAIRVLSESPALAARIANEIALSYINDQLDTKAEATEAATRWLADRVSSQRIDLETAETELREITRAANLPDAAATVARGEQLRDLRERARIGEAQALDAEAVLESMRRAVEAGQLRDAAALLPTVSAPLRRALSQGAEPAVLDPLVRDEVARFADGVQRRRATSDALAQGVQRLEQEVALNDAARVRIEQLTSEVQAARLIYETLLSRLNETANQFGNVQADARVVSTAFPPENPAEPKRSLIVALGAILAGLLGCALAFLLEALDSRVRSARALETRLGVPVLAQLPKMRRGRAFGVGIERIARSPFAVEGAQTLRTAVVLRGGGSAPRAVMVTSSRAHEGKSTASLMLAYAEAAIGKSILLIDADFRRPALYQAFKGLSGAKVDLVAVLEGRASVDEALHVDTATGIAVLPVLRPTANGSRLVASENFRNLVAALRSRFEMIVIDAPPVMLVSDAYAIGKLADATVYAVRWSDTPHELVSLGLAKLEQHGVAVIGAVLTFVDFAVARRYDDIEYGSYTVNNPYLPA